MVPWDLMTMAISPETAVPGGKEVGDEADSGPRSELGLGKE